MFIPRNMYYRGLSEGQSKLVSELGKKTIGESRQTAQEQCTQESYMLPVLHPHKQTSWNELQCNHNCCTRKQSVPECLEEA